MIALRDAPQATASLDKPIDDDGETALGDLLQSDAPEPIEEVAAGERTEVVSSALDELPAPEREVIETAVTGSRTARRSRATRSPRSSA